MPRIVQRKKRKHAQCFAQAPRYKHLSQQQRQRLSVLLRKVRSASISEPEIDEMGRLFAIVDNKTFWSMADRLTRQIKLGHRRLAR